MRTLPSLVTQLCMVHDGWIIGSAANPDVKFPKDYDVLIPFHNWKEACLTVTNSTRQIKANTFGGWKLDSWDTYFDQYFNVDVWPGDLCWQLTHLMCNYIWHPKSGKRFESK